LRCRPCRSFVWGGAAAGCLGRSTVPRTATAGIRAGPGGTPDTRSQAVPGFDHDAGQGRAAVMTPAPATRGRADHVSSCRGHPPLVDDELHLTAISVSLPAGHPCTGPPSPRRATRGDSDAKGRAERSEERIDPHDVRRTRRHWHRQGSARRSAGRSRPDTRRTSPVGVGRAAATGERGHAGAVEALVDAACGPGRGAAYPSRVP
jgi:hypothetical protein